jgi:predicted transport protein
VLNKLGQAKADEIDWSMPCVICIASDFTRFDEHAVNQMQRNIKLVRYKKYNDTHLLFELLNAPNVSSIPADETDAKTVNSGKTPASNVTFKGNYAKAPEAMRTLYQSAKDYILSLGDDISENELKLYTAFKKVKNFVCVEIYNKYLIVQLHLDPQTVELLPGFVEDYSAKGHWGTGDLRVIVKSLEDFEKAKPLFDRAYNEN